MNRMKSSAISVATCNYTVPLRIDVRSTILVIVTLIFVAINISDAHADRKDRTQANMEKARAYCANFETEYRMDCTVDKCPCPVGKRKIKKFKQKLSRGACVCLTKSDKAELNKIEASLYCADWNDRFARSDAHCVVTSGRTCLSKNKNTGYAKFASSRMKLKVFAGAGMGNNYVACQARP